MSGFSADWLSLRATADDRAINPAVAARLADTLGCRRELRIVDLGAGTGATLRRVAPRLPARQHWQLVDNDPALLARIRPPGGVGVATAVVDLAGDLDALFAPPPDLVTASAFFDLAGAAWIDAFVERLAGTGGAVYATLTYDGRELWEPAHRLDMAALVAFHADQQRDKGLGFALGPDAPAYLAHRLREAGYAVETGPSDWRLVAPRDARLIAALAQGSAEAITPSLGEEARIWADARLTARAVSIGHLDIFAHPA